MIARLFRLFLLRQGATIRGFLKGLRSPKRFLLVLATVALFGLVYLPSALGRTPSFPFARESLAVLCGMILFTSVAAGFVQQGPAFSSADVDFLFPAPFSPRHLLVWRLLNQYPMSLIATLFLWLTVGSRLDHPGRFIVGMSLVQAVGLHVQLFIAIVLTQVESTLARRLHGIARVVATLGFVGAVLTLVMLIVREGGVGEILRRLLDVPTTRVLFFPAIVCGDFVFGATLPQTVRALSLLALCAVVTLALVLAPSIDYLEDSIDTTARINRLLARRRRGDVMVDAHDLGSRRTLRVSAYGRVCAGAGALVYKNLLLFVRSLRTVLPGLAIALVAMSPIFFATQDRFTNPWMIVALLLLPVLMVAPQFGFDFRREHERLDALRALPLSASALVFAELIVPWMLCTILEEIAIGALAWLKPAFAANLSLVALMVPMPIFTLCVIDNLAIFLFPPRAGGSSRGAFGTTSAAALLRLLAFGGTVVPSGFLFQWAVDYTRSLAWGAAAAAFVQCCLTGAFFALLVRLFQRRELGEEA